MPDNAAIVNEMLKVAEHLEDLDGHMECCDIGQMLLQMSEGMKSEDVISFYGLDEEDDGEAA